MKHAFVLLLMLLGMMPALPVSAAAENDAMAIKHYNRGTDFYARCHFAEAEKELTEAIRLVPNAADAYYNRGWSYRRRQMNDEALADFTQAIGLYSHPAFYLSRANARIVVGELDGAIEDATRASQLEPEA